MMKPFYKIRRIKHTVFVVLGVKVSIRNKSAADYEFIMTAKERRCFEKYVLKSKSYLAFGLGGSTIFYLRNSSGKVCSVESSSEWLEFMRRKNVIVKNEAKGRLEIFQADIGSTKAWGYPVNENAKDKFPAYSMDVFKKTNKRFDLILVDGRFRVACVLAALINQSQNDPIIAIHDFWIRDSYHIVLKYLDVVEKVDTMGVFKAKKNINKDELLADYEKFKYDFD